MKRAAKRLFREAFVASEDPDGWRDFQSREIKTKSERTVTRGIQRLADSVGVPLSTRDAEPWISDDELGTFCWDGESIAMGRRNRSDIVHDIAHHQCSDTRRRLLPEWGLGTSPDGTREAECITDTSGGLRDEAQREEECASLLGILWERELGMEWTATMDDHNWLEEDENVGSTLQKLRRWNLVVIDSTGKVTPLPNVRQAKTRV